MSFLCRTKFLGIFSCHVRGCSFQKSLRSWHAVIDNGRVWNPFCIMTLEDFVLLSRWAARVFKAHGLQFASNMQWFWLTFLPAWNRQFWHDLLLHFQNIYIYITIRICNIYTKVWRCLQSLQNHPNSSCKHHPYHTLSQNTHNPRGHWGASDIIVTSITTARRLSTTWQLTYKIAVPQNPWGKLGWGMKTPCPGGVVLGKVAQIGSWDIDLDIDIEYEHPLPFADITSFVGIWDVSWSH